jgi:hypothetical protein
MRFSVVPSFIFMIVQTGFWFVRITFIIVWCAVPDGVLFFVSCFYDSLQTRIAKRILTHKYHIQSITNLNCLLR